MTVSKEFSKQEISQVKSAKSLSKRKELELDMKAECSKFVQNTKKNKNSNRSNKCGSTS